MTDTCRLYLISPPKIQNYQEFSELFRCALGAGDVACMQLRLKTESGAAVPDNDVLRASEMLLPIARAHDVAFLINDRPDLALQAGADGVHVGQNDVSYSEARAALGPDATVGVTCHNSKDLAVAASEAGADYVAFGAFFHTNTKETSSRADPGLLEWWRYATTVPSVAIGGITSENCGDIVRAGADFIAVSSSVWNDLAGPASAVKALNAAIAAA